MTQPYDPSSSAEQPSRPVHQRPWFVVVAGLAAMAVLGAIIGDTSADDPAEAAASSTSPSLVAAAPTTTEVPSRVPTPPESSPAPTPAPTPPESSPTPSPVDFVMPDVVGQDLQSAQNLIQTFGVFYTVSHDLRGSRNQVLDSNWLVCNQSVPPGQRVTGEAEGQIDFGVVKREESCP